MNIDQLAKVVQSLAEEMQILRAEAEIHRLQVRYIFLCDTPCPEWGLEDNLERIERILDLYTEDGVWEGIGAYLGDQFGRIVGKDALRKHFQNLWVKSDPALLLNVTYLTSEQIHVRGDEAVGQWVQCQPWVFSDGSSLLRSSRLNNGFRRVNGEWKMSHTRTENVFVTPLSHGWAQDISEHSVIMRPSS